MTFRARVLARGGRTYSGRPPPAAASASVNKQQLFHTSGRATKPKRRKASETTRYNAPYRSLAPFRLTSLYSPTQTGWSGVRRFLTVLAGRTAGVMAHHRPALPLLTALATVVVAP